jgi:hypothetical protein
MADYWEQRLIFFRIILNDLYYYNIIKKVKGGEGNEK